MMRPRRALQHAAGGPLGDPVRRGEVGVDDAREVVLAHPEHEAVARDARVGHEDLDRAAELLLDGSERGVDLRRR
jgi:hypothetical protein